jgi:hypothetical protein
MRSTNAWDQMLFFEEFLPHETGDTIVAWRNDVAVGHIVVMTNGATPLDKRTGNRASWDLSIGTHYQCGHADSVEKAKGAVLEAFYALCVEMGLEITLPSAEPARWHRRGIVLQEDVERIETYEKAEAFMAQKHIKRIIASLEGDPEWPMLRRAIWAHMKSLPRGDEDGSRQEGA